MVSSSSFVDWSSSFVVSSSSIVARLQLLEGGLKVRIGPVQLLLQPRRLGDVDEADLRAERGATLAVADGYYVDLVVEGFGGAPALDVLQDHGLPLRVGLLEHRTELRVR